MSYPLDSKRNSPWASTRQGPQVASRDPSVAWFCGQQPWNVPYLIALQALLSWDLCGSQSAGADPVSPCMFLLRCQLCSPPWAVPVTGSTERWSWKLVQWPSAPNEPWPLVLLKMWALIGWIIRLFSSDSYVVSLNWFFLENWLKKCGQSQYQWLGETEHKAGFIPWPLDSGVLGHFLSIVWNIFNQMERSWLLIWLYIKRDCWSKLIIFFDLLN